MITNTGKSIIGKYLLGQAPAYASYLAVGCGASPVASGDPFGDYSAKENLDFEMFRVPISSRGFVNESGINKIVLTAELPTEERYEITEVGLYSAGTNPSAGSYGSKTIFSFASGENWVYRSPGISEIPTVQVSLDSSQDINYPAVDNTITGFYDINNTNSAVETPVFETNADNPLFYKVNRAEKYERPRFLNNTLLVRGDTANLTKTVNVTSATGSGSVVTYTTALPHTFSVGDVVTITGVSPGAYNLASKTVVSVPTPTTFTVSSTATGTYTSGGSINTNHFIINTGSNHISLTNPNTGFSQNSPVDEMRLAFSLVKKVGGTQLSPNTSVPSTVRVLIEFSSSDTSSAEFARFEAELTNGSGAGQYPFLTNRYFVISKKLQELYTTANFTWDSVISAKIYVSTIASGSASDQYYVALDALRLENIASQNPLYGLTGYSVVENTNAETVIKLPNTSNYVEFRFSIGVT
jgi:hypothetical protein